MSKGERLAAQPWLPSIRASCRLNVCDISPFTLFGPKGAQVTLSAVPYEMVPFIVTDVAPDELWLVSTTAGQAAQTDVMHETRLCLGKERS